MYDYWAVTVPKERTDHKKATVVEEFGGNLMCNLSEEKKLAPFEHVIRIAPCWAEAFPICARVKVTRLKKSALKSSKSAVVLGWAEIAPAETKGRPGFTRSRKARKAQVWGSLEKNAGCGSKQKVNGMTCQCPFCRSEEERKCDEYLQSKGKGLSSNSLHKKGHADDCKAYKAQKVVLDEADPMIRKAIAAMRFKAAPKDFSDLGEGTGGRRGGATCNGKFFASAGGSNRAGNDEALLGESNGRRGASTTTASTFELSSSSNRAGNDESLY